MGFGFILIITLLAILLGLFARQALANIDDITVDATSIDDDYLQESYDFSEDYDLDSIDHDYGNHQLTGE